jgi:chromosome partitioning protein
MLTLPRAAMRGEVMLVISLVSSKGGCGKSTLATNLAVEATRAGIGTIIVDLDSQATAWHWGQKREADLPQVVASQAPALPALLKEAQGQGVGLVVIDTPPRADTVGVQAAKLSDFILIPCQPSGFDLDAMSASLMAAQLAGKPATIVINGALTSSGITEAVAKALTDGGAKVAPVRLGLRVDFRHPLPLGQAASEWDAKGKAAQEVTALWTWLGQQAGMSALQRGVTPASPREVLSA